MSINVHIGDSNPTPWTLVCGKDGRLAMPSIHIKVIDGTLPPPIVHRVVVRITGNDTGVKTLAPAYNSYPQPFMVFDGGYELLSDLACEPFVLKLADDELPEGTYVLAAEVFYRRSSHFPGGKPFEEITARGERHLLVPYFPPPCRLVAEWKRREAIIDRTGAELQIFADRLPANGMLEVSVIDERQLLTPELRSMVESALRQNPPSREGEAKPSGRTTFVLKIELNNLEEKSRDLILSSVPSEIDLRISARVESRQASEGRPTEYEEIGWLKLEGEKESLRIDREDNVFAGFPIIDIGTSSMFAVIYSSQMKSSFLPVEQEQSYRTNLVELLSKTEGAFGDAAWTRMLAGCVAQLLPNANPDESPARALLDYLRRNRPTDQGVTDSGLQRLLRALELQATMLNAPMEVRLEIRNQFSRLHAQAFARFPLRSQRLVPVNLDLSVLWPRRAEGQIAQPIPSVTEVVSSGVKRGELRVDIGESANNNRRETARSMPERLRTQFHSSPKLYYDLLGRPMELVSVSSGGEIVKVSPRDFLVASMIRLRERIDMFREKEDQLSKSRFNKVVLTFPTSAPLNVRTELLKVAQEAGFDQPISDLDEALSAIVFHLVKPFGNDKEMGLEAFRTTCRPVIAKDASMPREWLQNLLLVDVGGGTTDIALVEAKLTDETPVTHDSALGRYYQLTPTLLGATGKGQSAGNLLTLQLFHELKKRIADAVLSKYPDLVAESEDKADLDFLQAVRSAATTIQEPFGIGGKYQAGSIIEHYNAQQLWRDDVSVLAPEAYRLADQVMPTAWHDKGEEMKSAARRFEELWDLAENLKVTRFTTTREKFTMDAARLAVLLGVSQGLAAQVPEIAINHADFLAAVEPPLNQIAEKAANLVSARLTRADPPTDPNGEITTHRTLDRIILTGRTCKLPLVMEIIAAAFRRLCDGPSAVLRWDPSQITYEDDYAKQAAAIGASYAQVLREHYVPPNLTVKLSANQLYVNINNLFFYLQSGFRLRNPGSARGYDVLLPVGRQFQHFDDDGVGHLTSEWVIKPSETVSIDRFDYDADASLPWGEFNCKQFAADAGITWPDPFQAEVNAAIETDHRLVVRMLFCRGPEQHYWFPETPGEWNLVRRLVELKLISDSTPAPLPTPMPQVASRKVAPAQAPPSPPAMEPTPTPIPEDWLSPIDGWVLSVNEGSQYPMTLLKFTPDMFDKTFRTEDLTEVRGVLSPELPPCPESGLDEFSIRPADGTRGPVVIGSVRRPKAKHGRPGPIRAVLTKEGDLRIQDGDLKYAISTRATDLQKPGMVIRRPLGYSEIKPVETTDPFCGRH